jgi:hypothetical protein
MLRPLNLFARTLAVATLVGGLAVGPALYAAPSDDPMTPFPSAESAAKEQKGHKTMSSDARVEERIKELHDKLKITEDQTDAWGKVADTMRENEKIMEPLIRERHENGSARTAIEDLESYQKIAAAHADSLGKFVAVFQPLYDSMSDEQKKNADTMFGKFEGHEHMKGKASHKSK